MERKLYSKKHLIHTYIYLHFWERNCFGPTNSFEWNILVSKLKGAAQRTKMEAKLINILGPCSTYHNIIMPVPYDPLPLLPNLNKLLAIKCYECNLLHPPPPSPLPKCHDNVWFPQFEQIRYTAQKKIKGVNDR